MFVIIYIGGFGGPSYMTPYQASAPFASYEAAKAALANVINPGAYSIGSCYSQPTTPRSGTLTTASVPQCGTVIINLYGAASGEFSADCYYSGNNVAQCRQWVANQVNPGQYLVRTVQPWPPAGGI